LLTARENGFAHCSPILPQQGEINAAPLTLITHIEGQMALQSAMTTLQAARSDS
jgi:hypothetical protein